MIDLTLRGPRYEATPDGLKATLVDRYSQRIVERFDTLEQAARRAYILNRFSTGACI